MPAWVMQVTECDLGECNAIESNRPPRQEDGHFSKLSHAQSSGDLVKISDSNLVGVGWCLGFCIFVSKLVF